MSLVICSNNDSDDTTLRQSSSVYKAFSFRNDLASTYTIPPNSQVALQSCKVNIDGRVSVSGQNNKFYTFFGPKLDRDGTTSPQISEVPSTPALVDLTDGVGQVLELSKNDFANTLQFQMRNATYHPNQKDQVTAEPLTEANLDFKGYRITYDQNTTLTNTVPPDGSEFQFYSDDTGYQDADFIFDYTNGVLTRDEDFEGDCVATFLDQPLSLCNGSMIVNVSGTNANANASGVEWHVGLSRFVPFTDGLGYYNPGYSDPDDFTDTMNLDMAPFADFAVARNQAGELACYQWQCSSSLDFRMTRKEVTYWNNGSSDYSGEGGRVSADNITNVRFSVAGERVKVEVYNAVEAQYFVVTQFNSGETKPSMFKPVLQTCWCLHPVLAIDVGAGGADTGCSVEITHFDTPNIADYNPRVFQKGGWYESMAISQQESLCADVDGRRLFSFGAGLSTVYAQKGLNASGGVDYDQVLILQPSNVYSPSPGANANALLGFNGLVDTPTTPTGNQLIFDSVAVPSLVNPLSLFVRLDNLGQDCLNARSKNTSKILAHLTTLENKVGRQVYEPSNLVYLDLNNPSELRLTSFDVSFTYINEQFATILTGQSVVSLLFRQKPS